MLLFRRLRSNVLAAPRQLSCLIALGVLCSGVVRAQIAPGPLSQAHADLKGITGCASCHDLFNSGLKCLECHGEIKRRVEAGTGYHSHAYRRSAGSVDCARCHAEHRGERYPLIPLDRKSFDHGTQTGFALEGRHREQSCENCHTAARISTAARSEIRIKDLNRSFLGLRRDCTLCHQEPHGNPLGTDCLRCHTPEAWKPASKFNHSSTAFPLTGMHQRLPCEKCHARAMAASGSKAQVRNVSAQIGSQQRPLLFKGLSFNGCQSCHPDQHRGAFQDLKGGSRCDRCHNTGGFRGAGNGFDHTISNFRLVGKHAALPCQKCHKEGNFARPIRHEFCGDCHVDPHKGQFASRAAGSDCSACHRPTSFKPALFDRTTHAGGAFPLVGRHSTLACVKCHQAEDGEKRDRTANRTCSRCHSEPHGDEFASEPYNDNCGLCHAEAGFGATSFSAERHAQTRFPLTGRHAGIACRQCHQPLSDNSKSTPETAGARRQYHFASRDCNVCHADPHRMDTRAKLPCETCHTPQGWNTPLSFDHSRSPFKLEGSHQHLTDTSTCARCHKASGQVEGVGAGAVPIFSGAIVRCSACHSEKDPHGGQFNGAEIEAKDCSQCHAPQSWNAVIFDHSKTRFTLTGAHLNMACKKCHKEQEDSGGRMIRLYRKTPADCLSCH